MEPDRPLDTPARGRSWKGLLGAGAVAAVLAMVAIGSQVLGSDDDNTDQPAPGAGESSPTGRTEPTYEWSDSPPPVVLRLPDGDVELEPWTYCWSGPAKDDGTAAGMCADGTPGPVSKLPVVEVDELEFWFGMPDWSFDVTFQEVGVDCPRSHTANAVATGPKTFRIEPQGPHGRYQVDIFGRGKGGDVITSFVWKTSWDGPVEQPASYLALVTDDGPRFTSYGVELGVSDLGFQPQEATATITVTSASGEAATFTPRLERGRGDDCYQQGSVFFFDRDMDAIARQVAALGEGPFDYRVVLTLDGEEFVGTAVWPRDEKKDEAPNTPLTFDPPLPAYVYD